MGRTARAGRSGRAVSFVSQYDVELFKRIEELIGKRLEAYPTVEEEVLLMQERVMEAQRFAKMVSRGVALCYGTQCIFGLLDVWLCLAEQMNSCRGDC